LLEANIVKARVKLAKAGTQEITVQADDYFKARAMIEAQYGKGCIITGPNQVLK
jgi:hypothetical protein